MCSAMVCSMPTRSMQVVGGLAGQDRLERAQPVARPRAASHRSDVVAGLGQVGLGGGELLGGLCRRRLRRREPFAGLVELLGEHFEVVGTGGDEFRGLLGGGRLLRFGSGRGGGEGDAAGGGEGQEPCAGTEATVRRRAGTRHEPRVGPSIHGRLPS